MVIILSMMFIVNVAFWLANLGQGIYTFLQLFDEGTNNLNPEFLALNAIALLNVGFHAPIMWHIS